MILRTLLTSTISPLESIAEILSPTLTVPEFMRPIFYKLASEILFYTDEHFAKVVV